MASLTAVFNAIDKTSSILEGISNNGQEMVSNFTKAEDTINHVLSGIDRSATSLTAGVDKAGKAIDRYGNSSLTATDQSNEYAEAMETVGQAQNEVSDAMEDGTNIVEMMSEAQNEAATAMDKCGENVKAESNELQELVQVTEKADSATDEFSDALKKADESTKTFEESCKITEESYKKTGEEAEKSGKKVQDATEKLASTMTSAGIAKILKEVKDSFMEASDAAAIYETAIKKISTVADTTEISLSEISSDITTLSLDTGQAVNELSEATYSAISASVDTADAVDFTSKATKLATGGFTSSATSVDVLTTSLNAYGLEASKAESISDMLITTQNLGKTTVNELASSVGKVIPIASAYGVEMDNLSTAYAELTKGGIATAEAGTYLKAMLNELGDSGSKVSEVLMEKTGSSFAQLTSKGKSLGDIMEVLGNSVNGNAGAFNELWSSSEAGVGALALYNAGAEQFNTTLKAMDNSLGATQIAYEAMTDTTEHAHEEMTNAANNLKIAIGQNINPLVKKLYELGTEGLNLITKFSREQPVISKVLSSGAVGLATVGTALVGVVTTTKIAIPAFKAFGVALNEALGPIGWISIAVTGLTVAGAALVSMMSDMEDETYKMTSVTKNQYDKLQSLNSEYESTCEKLGEMSPEASALRYKMHELNEEYEATAQTIEEFATECDAVINKHDELMKSIDENSSAVQTNRLDNLALISKLEQLSSQTNKTAGSQKAMRTVFDELNSSIDGLNMSYSDFISNQDSALKSIKKRAEEQAKAERQQEKYNEYVELLKQASGEEEKLSKATDEVAQSQKRSNEAMDAYASKWSNDSWLSSIFSLFTEDFKQVRAADKALETATEKQDELKSSLDETKDRISEIEEEYGMFSDTAIDCTDPAKASAEAVSTAFETYKSKIDEVCAAYDEAYEAAYNSFQGQFGLFETATLKSEEYLESTVSNAQKALDSQLEYWNSYSADIETLRNVSYDDLNISKENYEALMAYVQNGSEEAAGLAHSMVKNIESGNEEAVSKLADTLGKVNGKQSEIAKATADWSTNFSIQMDEIEKKMQDTVEGLNLSDEATAAATSTITSYANEITRKGQSAVSAAEEVARKVSVALSKASATINLNVNAGGGIEQNATGTTHSADVFIAGEEGPELVVGKAGSTVFPTTETDRIIEALNLRTMQSTTYSENTGEAFFNGRNNLEDMLGSIGNIALPIQEKNRIITTSVEDAPIKHNSAPKERQEQEKKIVLEIVGGGKMEVANSNVKENFVDMLYDNIKPVLMNIISSEIYEEGDMSYDY